MIFATADLSLWAVHIGDGFLTPAWVVGGAAVAALAAAIALGIDYVRARWLDRELGEADVALIGVMTAAFYVATLIRVPVGPTSVHLLFNGLLGVTLRWRAALAIPVGLFFQAALFGHGGFSTLGVNSCVLGLPALLAWGLFAGLHRLPWLRRPWFRGLLVTVSVAVWTVSLVFSLALLTGGLLHHFASLDAASAGRLALHPLTVLLALVLGIVFAALEPKLETAPEFPLGLLIGILTVLATMAGNCLVLIYGGAEDWRSVALLTFVAHMPVAVVEGLVLGSTVGFLAKVKPALLGMQVARQVHALAAQRADEAVSRDDTEPALSTRHHAGSPDS